jgi:hypothetical protein
MSLSVSTLPEKQPSEIVPFSIDLANISTFGDGTETIASVAWSIYNDTDEPGSFTDLSGTMKYGESFTGIVITCQVQGGVDGQTYILRALVTCSSGDIYEVDGRFRVKEVG